MDGELMLIILKSAFMLLFFFIVIIIGSLPIHSTKFKSSPLLRSIGSTFAGGLFINVSIIHILPQSYKTLQQYLQNGNSNKSVFPLANLLLMIGFLITIFFTKIISKHSHQQTQFKSLIITNNNNQDHQKKQLNTHGNNQQLDSNHNQTKLSFNQAYVLTLAMYFHTIFQGLAIGVQSNLQDFLAIAVAIAFHKWADALSMGCHYRSKKLPNCTSYTLIIGQAILNVLAIGAGWLISSTGEVIEAIFLSISAGTFLSISTMQLLSEQLHSRQYIFMKYILLLFSTAFISTIWFVQNSIFG